jgi:hypothetical protein
MVTKIQLFDSSNTKPLWMVIKNEKLFPVSLILMLILILISHLNNKSGMHKWQICYSSQWMFESTFNPLKLISEDHVLLV